MVDRDAVRRAYGELADMYAGERSENERALAILEQFLGSLEDPDLVLARENTASPALLQGDMTSRPRTSDRLFTYVCPTVSGVASAGGCRSWALSVPRTPDARPLGLSESGPSNTPMDPETLRADVPAFEETVYLNTGASGPSPRRVVEASERALERLEHEAPAGEGMYPAAIDLFDEAREAAAAHVGTDPANVALTESTTDGMGSLIGAMDWEPGDVVVRTNLEHAAGVFPCDRVRREEGAEIRVVETSDGRVDREAYAEAVEDARLVVFSSLTWTHGTRLPVTELVDIAHDAGARVLVDAVQSVGQHPVDVEAWGADAVAASGHKWLLGTWGAGFLYVDPEFAQELTPPVVGYSGVEDGDADTYELRHGARRFEVGTTAVGPSAALVEAIDLAERMGYGTITDRVERLTDRLKAGIDDRLRSPRAYESGLVSFAAEDAASTVDRLAEAGVQVRSIPHGETVRASVHAINTAEDVDALLAAL